MNKISCKVIEDLSPLYADQVCSDESKQLVEEHILECKTCKEKLEAMQQNLPISQPIVKEYIAEKKLFHKVKKMWIASILLVILLSFILFLCMHRLTLFQEGNPLYYSKSFVQLLCYKDYVDITNVGEKPSEKFRFLTKKDDYKEFFKYIENKYQIEFSDQMGSAYLFGNDKASLALVSKTYMSFFTIWTVGDVHYKYANNIFTEDLLNNLKEIDIIENNDTTIIGKDEIHLIYNYLSPLTLTEIENSDNTNLTNDFITMNLITSNEILTCTLSSDELRIKDRRYSVKNNLRLSIKQQAINIKYKDYFK